MSRYFQGVGSFQDQLFVIIYLRRWGMRIAVFGAGSVGGYFGGRLAQLGEEVVFIARGEHLEALQTEGLKVESIKGDFIVSPANAVGTPEEAGEVNVVLLGVKAWQVPEAARAMAPMIGGDTFIVPLQNGVEAPDILASLLGKDHVLGGLCRISSLVQGPGYIRHPGIEPYIAFGELDGRPSERAEKLKSAFENAGVWAEIPANIRSAMWEKFVFISPFSGVGSATRAPIGVMRSLPRTRDLLEKAVQETAGVGRANGVSLTVDIVEKTMAFYDGLPEDATSSMQRDIQAGRPSELEAQNGAVVRLGEKAGEPTEVNLFIYSALLPSELKARGKLKY
jgi:2-dehydropantoate 2-reductase